MHTIDVSSSSRNQIIDLTSKIKEIFSSLNLEEGLCLIYCPHTTAGICINENADDDVKIDMIEYLSKLVSKDEDFQHLEGNSDAHIKASLIGNSKVVPISNNQIVLGTWQGIFFCEFDGPRQRKVHIQFIGG